MKYWLVVVLAVGGILLAAWAVFTRQPAASTITSFDDCTAAGLPVMDSYPAQCRAPSGQVFVQDIGNELELAGLIQISSPRPNQQITSPLTITGQARGQWFFEAQLSGRLVDASGNDLGTVILTADGEWMTEDFVPFTGTLNFTAPQPNTAGRLLLDRANPSGLPEHAGQLVVPVKF